MTTMSRRCIPYTPNHRALSELTIALVTTAGVHLLDQPAFNPEGEKEFRVIPADADRDVNCVFPLDRLRELAAQGLIGDVSNLHIGYMGTSPRLREVYEETAPAIADRVERSKAD